MLRRLIQAVLRLGLRIFFRRIEVREQGSVPATGPAIFVVNHPNGLVDPVFLLCFSPRRVAFLAKEPLFRMPAIGFFVRALDSIPVHRREDSGADPARNVETFAAARSLLSWSGAIAIFPEGGSHADPKLRPARTGAARIALAAAARVDGAPAALQIVPAGLYYTARARFRSGALLTFGEPFGVPSLPLAGGEEPPRDSVRELTARIEHALEQVTFQADSQEALELVSRAERILAAGGQEAASLSDELDRRRRLGEGAARLRQQDPERFEKLAARIDRFETERREAGLSLEDLSPGALTTGAVFLLLARNAAALLLAPLALAGALLHYPAYRAAGALATRLARQEEDVVSTIKIGSSLLLFPATWIAAAALAGRVLGWTGALAALLLAPLSGFAALLGRERLDALLGRERALAHLVLESFATRRLLAERRAIREEIERLARELRLA